ncbi:MAG TPA: hypothetical protein VIL36_13345, partial [Acidimicrobiales bacterium]
MAAEPAVALRSPELPPRVVDGAPRGGAALRELAERVRPVELRSQQPTLPVVPGLQPLLPDGLVKGTTVAVGSVAAAGGATTLALALAAGPSQAGAWVALVGGAGRGMWGLVAAAGLGVVLERLVVVAPATRPVAGWGPVVAALVEGFPVVVVGPEVQLRSGDGWRLAARLRGRGGVLVRVGDASGPSAAHVR